jgi:hypothetical protein
MNNSTLLKPCGIAISLTIFTLFGSSVAESISNGD